MATERRQLLRLGATYLFIATLLGIVLGAGAANPVLWRAAFLISRISAGSILVLGLANAILNVPGPATAPGVAPQGVQLVVVIAILLTTVPTAIGSTLLVWRGLGGD